MFNYKHAVSTVSRNHFRWKGPIFTGKPSLRNKKATKWRYGSFLNINITCMQFIAETDQTVKA